MGIVPGQLVIAGQSLATDEPFDAPSPIFFRHLGFGSTSGFQKTLATQFNFGPTNFRLLMQILQKIGIILNIPLQILRIVSFKAIDKMLFEKGLISESNQTVDSFARWRVI